MWLSPKWFCFLFIYFVLYHGPEASKVQIKLTYLPTRAHEGKRLSIPKIRNMKFYRSIYYRAADSWNKLIPSRIILIDSRPGFKRLLNGLIVNPYTEDD